MNLVGRENQFLFRGLNIVWVFRPWLGNRKASIIFYMRKFLAALCFLLTVSLCFSQKLPQKAVVQEVLSPSKLEKLFLPPVKYVRPVLPSNGMISSVRSSAANTAGNPEKQNAGELAGLIEKQVAARVALQKTELSPLAKTEKYIRQSLVEVIGRNNGELLGSGFVVRSGAGKLYAVVSYHVVGHAGRTVAVRMYDAQGTPVVYNGLIVNRAGSFGINAPDAAIIALPPAAQKHVRPLQVAASLPPKASELIVWGSPYAANGFARIDELKVQLAQNVKIVMKSPDVSDDFDGLCGSPVLDEQGKVVGIYSGHDPKLGLVFAVNARQTLEWLIGSYEKGMTPAGIPFKVYGRLVMLLQAEETVGWVYHFDQYGTLLHKVYLPQYPGEFDPAAAECLFADVRHGDFLEFEIVKHRIIQRTISVGIE